MLKKNVDLATRKKRRKTKGSKVKLYSTLGVERLSPVIALDPSKWRYGSNLLARMQEYQ